MYRELKEELVSHRRKIHSIAETGFETEKTREYIKDALIKMGLAPRDCGRGGVVCCIGEGEGRCLLIRADIDAIPIREENELSFKSENGCMHACGHDMHAAMLLGCAELLAKDKRKINGTVKLVFQSAEELLEGAGDLVKNGVMHDPRVDFALGIHVVTGVNMDTGTLILPPSGICAPSADMFKIEVMGRGGHGSMPHKALDPVLPLCHIISCFEQILTRELSAGEGARLTVGRIECGTAPNVIAEKASAWGSIRAVEESTREYIKKRVCEITENVAKGMKTQGRVSFLGGAPALENDKELLKKIKEILDRTGLKRLEPTQIPNHMGGSDDFAVFASLVPSVYLSLCAGNEKEGYTASLHNSRVRFDEEALLYGTRALYEIAVSLAK